MKLPGFTADASLHTARGVYRASTPGDALDRTERHKAGGIAPAVDCNWLKNCCAQVPTGMRSLSNCCIQYQLYCT